MAEDNLEITKRYIAAFESADFVPSTDDVADDVTVDWSESHAPYAGTYRGHAGWQRLFSELQASFEEARIEVHDYIVAGPYVAVHNTSHLRGRGGVEVTATSTTVLTFGNDGKIVELKLFQDHPDALRAIDAAPRRASRP